MPCFAKNAVRGLRTARKYAPTAAGLPSPQKNLPMLNSLPPQKNLQMLNSLPPQKNLPICNSLPPQKNLPICNSLPPQKNLPICNSLPPQKNLQMLNSLPPKKNLPVFNSLPQLKTLQAFNSPPPRPNGRQRLNRLKKTKKALRYFYSFLPASSCSARRDTSAPCNGRVRKTIKTPSH